MIRLLSAPVFSVIDLFFVGFATSALVSGHPVLWTLSIALGCFVSVQMERRA